MPNPRSGLPQTRVLPPQGRARLLRGSRRMTRCFPPCRNVLAARSRSSSQPWGVSRCVGGGERGWCKAGKSGSDFPAVGSLEISWPRAAGAGDACVQQGQRAVVSVQLKFPFVLAGHAAFPERRVYTAVQEVSALLLGQKTGKNSDFLTRSRWGVSCAIGRSCKEMLSDRGEQFAAR